MSFYEKNLQALAMNDGLPAELRQRLTETEPATEFELYETPDGNFTIKYRDVYLHDRESPVREARETIYQHAHPHPDQLHIILGLGLGYLLDELSRATAGRIFVYEPDLPFMRFILENIDLSNAFTSGRVWLASNDVELLTPLCDKLLKQEQIDVLTLRSHAYLLAGEIPSLMEKIVNLFSDRMQDIRTSEFYHARWTEALFTNYPYFAGVALFDELRDRFKGKPAVIIASGPSLDKAIPALREVADCMVLVAVGGALKRLHEVGITPDFAMIYDAIGMQEQLDAVPADYLQKMTLLLGPMTQPYCYTAPAGQRVLFLSENSRLISEWLEGALGQKQRHLEGGGSVSLPAFQAALAMGCDPVVLVGQDLAYTDNQAYAGGIGIERNENGSVIVGEGGEGLSVLPAKPATVKGQNGEEMLSNVGYESFLRHFEDIAADMKRAGNVTRLFNASIGGAHIEGYPVRPLEEFKDEFEPWKTPGSFIFDAVVPAEAFAARKASMLQALGELREEVLSMLALLTDIQRLLPEDVSRDDDIRLPALRETVLGSVGRFYRVVEKSPFLIFFLRHQTLRFNNAFDRTRHDAGATLSDFRAVQSLASDSLEALRMQLLPLIETAQRQVHQAGQPAGVAAGA